MARQKKTTAKRGRPAKNDAAPKRKYARRKVRGTDTAIGAAVGLASPYLGMTAAQEAAGTRHQALYMALETRKLTQGVAVDVGALIVDAEKIRIYLSEGLKVKDDPVPAGVIDLDGPMSSGGDDEYDPNTSNPSAAPRDYPLAASAE